MESPLPGSNVRWHDPASYSPAWEWSGRAATAVAMLPHGVSAVCDIGCGAPQKLRTMIPTSAAYLPADLRAWTTDTEVCDLDAARFPNRSLARLGSDGVCVMLGVLEYIREPLVALAGLGARTPRLIFSYHPFDSRRVRQQAWTGRPVTLPDLKIHIATCGFDLASVVEIDGGQLLFDAIRGR